MVYQKVYQKGFTKRVYLVVAIGGISRSSMYTTISSVCTETHNSWFILLLVPVLNSSSYFLLSWSSNRLADHSSRTTRLTHSGPHRPAACASCVFGSTIQSSQQECASLALLLAIICIASQWFPLPNALLDLHQNYRQKVLRRVNNLKNQ